MKMNNENSNDEKEVKSTENKSAEENSVKEENDNEEKSHTNSTNDNLNEDDNETVTYDEVKEREEDNSGFTNVDEIDWDNLGDEEVDFDKLDEMSDDEAILALDEMTDDNDEVVERDYLSSLLEQGDKLIYYEVENIYKNDTGKAYKGRLKLRKDPPVLVIRDEDGNEARFYLTENLTDELSGTLKEVKRAYYGFSGPSDINKPDKFFDKVKYYIKNNPAKIIATIFIILFIISLNITL